jgi:hypothetical protein
MTVEMILNGKTQVVLVPETTRDKTLNRLAFDGNIVATMNLRDDGALVFEIKPKETA